MSSNRAQVGGGLIHCRDRELTGRLIVEPRWALGQQGACPTRAIAGERDLNFRQPMLRAGLASRCCRLRRRGACTFGIRLARCCRLDFACLPFPAAPPAAPTRRFCAGTAAASRSTPPIARLCESILVSRPGLPTISPGGQREPSQAQCARAPMRIRSCTATPCGARLHCATCNSAPPIWPGVAHEQRCKRARAPTRAALGLPSALRGGRQSTASG